MSSNESNNPKEPLREGIIHAFSHALAGTPARSILFVLTLGAISLVTWGVDFFLKKPERDAAIVIKLDEHLEKNYLFELDGRITHSTRTGRVRFDKVRPGHHFLAIFADNSLIFTAEANVDGGEELLITQSNLEVVSESIDLNSTNTVANKGLSKIDIIIDAGHGGEDPGAIVEISGLVIKEKFIALEAARSLKNIFETEGFTTLLIRDSDKYIPLKHRLNIVNERCEKLFISLHADAFRKKSINGFSVFGVSKKGMKSEIIRLKSNDSPLALTADKRFSSNYLLTEMIGESILREVTTVSAIHKESVQRAGFVVLKSPSCPSLLIELGFMTNSTDQIKLISPEHRAQLYTAISTGVKNALEIIK